MFPEAVFKHLSEWGAIEALQCSVFPVRLPQLPPARAIVYSIISSPHLHTMEGTSTAHTTLQVDCWATDSSKTSHLIAEAAKSALDGYRGLMGGLVRVHSSLLVNETDFFEPDVDDYRVSLDFRIWHN